MPARARLTDEQVVAIRQRHEDGETMTALGREFGASRQHVSRLIAEDARPRIAGLDEGLVRTGVLAAIEDYLDRGADRLAREAVVLAAAARVVAAKLDACGASDTGAAAAAVPRLAAELVGLLDALESGTAREPDAIDLLRQQRDARLLAMAARA